MYVYIYIYILENVGFFKETRQNLPFIEKHATNKFSYV